MKVLDLELNNSDGSAKVVSQFSANELAVLVQFAVNMAASIGLGVEKNHRAQQQDDFEDTRPGLND